MIGRALAGSASIRVGERRDTRLSTLARLIDREWICIVAISWFAAVLLILGPAVFSQDTWVTLVAGREIVQHGLPHVDALGVLTSGRTWTDQQWLAQLAYYGAWAGGGVKGLFFLQLVALLASATVAVVLARRHGGSVRAVSLAVPVMLLAAPWGWDARAQALAYVPFLAVLWLLLENSHEPRRRVLLVLPLLALWGNLHGSVVIGAILAVVWAGLMLTSWRRLATGQRVVATALGVLAPVAVLASPYATSLPGYYHRMLVDPPFAGLVLEWKRTGFTATTALFWLTVATVAILVARRRHTFTLFELLILAVLLVAAVDVVRNIVWFTLAAAVLLPRALTGHFHGLARRERGRLDRPLLSVALVALAVLAALSLTTLESRFDALWPSRLTDQVARLAGDDPVRVYADERLADWLLWTTPELRGRVAYDARVELLTRDEVARLVEFQSGLAVARSPVDGYQVVMLSKESQAASNLVANRLYRVLGRDRRSILLVSTHGPETSSAFGGGSSTR
jgi:hypothetical protein